VWRGYAENVTESLTRGMRVIVQGRLRSRSYETKEGEKRTVHEVEVEEVGPALRYATAKVIRTEQGGSTERGQQEPPFLMLWAMFWLVVAVIVIAGIICLALGDIEGLRGVPLMQITGMVGLPGRLRARCRLRDVHLGWSSGSSGFFGDMTRLW